MNLNLLCEVCGRRCLPVQHCVVRGGEMYAVAQTCMGMWSRGGCEIAAGRIDGEGAAK